MKQIPPQKSVNQATHSALGRATQYDQTYNPTRLFPIARDSKRIEIGIDPTQLPFVGFDCWNHYEVSWLNSKGKPIVATATLVYDCQSPFIIESKSMKLYFNSLNHTRFESLEALTHTVEKDLSAAVGTAVNVNLNQLGQASPLDHFETFSGECLDELDIECDTYQVTPNFLTVGDQIVQEVLYSDLLKSNCLVTNQPDWGSVQITYKGNQINREGLLRYIISFRNHDEFHEQCVERIFHDIMQHCRPQELTVHARYTRRGGIEINPYRSSLPANASLLNFRLVRQ